MKKLTLQADALEVESFSTDVERDGDTVQPPEFFATRPQVCDPLTVPPRCA